jgi:radical SAM-linked protein
MMRAFFRSCIKNDIPVAVTQGFSPHLKLSFGHPLGVGISSSCEYLDIYMSEKVQPENIKLRLQNGLPEGIKIENVIEVSTELPSLTVSLDRAKYIIKIFTEYCTDVDGRIKRLFDSVDTIDKIKKIKELVFKNKELRMDVPVGQNGNVKPYDVLMKLWPELGPEELKLWHIHREELYNEGNNN